MFLNHQAGGGGTQWFSLVPRKGGESSASAKGSLAIILETPRPSGPPAPETPAGETLEPIHCQSLSKTEIQI